MHHQLIPTCYHRSLGPYSPVLNVRSGDTVSTTTVDAAGADQTGEAVTPRGNPQTGPIHVAEAEPGDTLRVTLDRIRPNRSKGWARSVVAPNVVDPTYVGQLPEAPLSEWTIDEEEGTATLTSPPNQLGKLTIPLEPMLGCFGVAPFRQQAISTATSGEHGGNMDYRGFVAGTTVYFPVFEPGGLFFLGDGHAAQGDGEIAGTGIEISMDVTVTLTVLKGKSIGWPRGENSDFIFTVGNARPLDQCLQHATTEMLRWLQQDYGLDPISANLLLSQCVRYDLGNMFDPAYTMVCKVPRKYLPNRNLSPTT
ncbi:acetamidase/formamidase family protein [Schlesneria sp. DSM 10557]|uniref:acetamidase/formamidase family protein n=1 Tax=Schlesneria sp. DSM 10557 TaxID=3044399 RepID=UPI0035A0AE71